MKTISFLSIGFFTALGLSCTDNPEYIITGTIENAAEGDTVTLHEVVDGELSPVQHTMVRDGCFSFRGRQDSAVVRYVAWRLGSREEVTDFILENGNIHMSLGERNVSITGTADNDIRQEVREILDGELSEIQEIYAQMADTALSAEQRDEAGRMLPQKRENYYALIKKCMKKHISNIVGVSLFKQLYRNNTLEENDSLLQHVPKQYQSDPTVIRIRNKVENGKNTVAGSPFVDFEMRTPNGRPAKLSDYAGHGKVVLLDFWASWCNPCRVEIQNLAALYEQYGGQDFEIVGVSLDTSEKAWKGAIAQLRVRWPQMSDLKGWKSVAAQLYAVQSIPHTVLIDAAGTVIDRGLEGSELRRKLSEIFDSRQKEEDTK